MAIVETLAVSQPPEIPPELWGSFIDSPTEGASADVYVLHVEGWVVGRAARAVQVEVVDQGRTIRTTAVRGARADLAELFPEVPADTDAVFHALVGVPGLAPEFELELRAVLEDGTRVPIGSIRARHAPLRPPGEPSLSPLLVTCLGRTGTTWLMRLLAEHPRIVIYDRYPYELSPARYWAHAVKVLGEPAELIHSSEPNTFHEDLWRTGHNPFYDDGVAVQEPLNAVLGRDYLERLAAFGRDSAERWYEAVAQAQGVDAPAYFAEKNMWTNYLPVLARELWRGAREVFLVRDFRDMAHSIMEFDRKRGFAGFGRLEGESDEDYVSGMLTARVEAFRAAWRARSADSHLVRYEDLVLRPSEALSALFSYLGLDINQGSAAQMLARASRQGSELAQHRTSGGLRDSVGRWRREGDDRTVALLEPAFADALEEFGYPPSGYSA